MITVVLAYLGYQSLSAELDTKFFTTSDSSPTKVYSSLYWLKHGTGASSDELRFRFKERDYREMSAEAQVSAPGSFYLENDAQGSLSKLTLFTNDFNYPSLAKEMFWGNPEQDIRPRKYSITWVNSEVDKIFDVSGNEIPAIALEPVLIAQLNQGGAEARKSIPIDQIPHTLMKGIVLVEDQRFLEHIGIDPRGIARSMYVNLRSGAYVQGASTITQQLARNIYLSRQKTITRKLMEVVMSVVLEIKFTKDQILEKYLNEVYFGQSGNVAIHGVSEAARFYFNKTIDELSIAEQAMIAGLVRGPFFYSPFRHYERAKARQEIVLKKMLEAGVITEGQYKSAIAERLKFAKSSIVQNRAPYFTDMVQAQLLKDLPEQEVVGAGYTIFSTLDTYYQHLAEVNVAAGVASIEARLKQYIEKRQKNNKDPSKEEEARLVQGVYIGVDPANGYLLSLVGGRSYEESNYNRALLMRRHIGSLIKPFVYLAALMYAKNPDGTPLNAISKFEDKPFTYEFDEKKWSPKNYEDEFAGTVTLRFALANSINTVAAQIAILTGLDMVVDVAKKAGFETQLNPFPSLALGAVDVAPMEVATAYTTLANFGMRKEITSTLLVVAEDGRLIAKFMPRQEQVLPPEETSNLVNLLSSVFDFGTAKFSKEQGFIWPASGKTGTTNEFRDAWFAGFTNKTLGISWIGFDRDDEVVRRHRKALKLTGAVAALPVWLSVMKNIHKNQPLHPIAYPDGMLRKLEVDLITGERANNQCLGTNVVEETFTYRNQPAKECN